MIVQKDFVKTFLTSNDFYSYRNVRSAIDYLSDRNIPGTIIGEVLLNLLQTQSVTSYRYFLALRVLAARKILDEQQQVRLGLLSIEMASRYGNEDIYDTLALLSAGTLRIMLHQLLLNPIHDHEWLAFAAAAHLSKDNQTEPMEIASEDFKGLLAALGRETSDRRKQEMREVVNRVKKIPDALLPARCPRCLTTDGFLGTSFAYFICRNPQCQSELRADGDTLEIYWLGEGQYYANQGKTWEEAVLASPYGPYGSGMEIFVNQG